VSRGIAEMQTFGVGIIGFGFMGRTHAYGHVNLPLFYDPAPCRTRLVGVATSRRETAEAAKEALGFEVATTDWRALIDRPDIQIIHVCTPNKYHKEQVLAALAGGKHVYCARVTHQMVLHNRFFPATMRAKAMVEAGFLGDVLSLRAAYLHSGSVDPNAPLKWKLDADLAGGGVLLDLGSHVLDLVQHLVGPVSVLDCRTQIAYPERPVLDDPTRLARVTAEDAVCDGRGGRASFRDQRHPRSTAVQPHGAQLPLGLRPDLAGAGARVARAGDAAVIRAARRIPAAEGASRLAARPRGMPSQLPFSRCARGARGPKLAGGRRAAVPLSGRI